MSPQDIDALRAFYVGNRQPLYTYAVSITGNREVAEDVIHGVFEKLLRGGRLPAELRPYVFRAVRNAAFDGWRRAKVRADSIFETPAAPGANEPVSPAAAPVDDFEPLLRQLPADEREAIVLKIYSGFTFQQIAELRDAPLPTVASWYRRGLERLRTLLTTECR
jgi:RNA polymerase sigma-70 factor, ECF subfamily